MQEVKPGRLLNIMKEMEVLKQESDAEMVHDKADELLIETCYVLLEKSAITKNRQRQIVDRIVKAYNELEKWYA